MDVEKSNKLKALNKAFLYAPGSTGTVFFHSLLQDHPQILSIPVILSSHTAYKLMKKVRFEPEASRKILCEKTELKLLVDKMSTPRKGDFSSYKFDADKFFHCLTQSLTQKLQAQSQIDQEVTHHLIHLAFVEATDTSLAQKKYVIEHTHNMPSGEIEQKKVLFRNPRFIMMNRDPRANLYSFFSFLYNNNQDLSYTDITKRIRAIHNSYSQFFSNLDSFTVVNLEELHTNPEKVLRRFCEEIGIDFHASLLDSTFAGKKYVSNSVHNKNVHGFSSRVIEKKYLKLPREDIFYIEQLFSPNISYFGYSLESGATKKVKNLLQHNFLNGQVLSEEMQDLNSKANILQRFRNKKIYKRKAQEDRSQLVAGILDFNKKITSALNHAQHTNMPGS